MTMELRTRFDELIEQGSSLYATGLRQYTSKTLPIRPGSAELKAKRFYNDDSGCTRRQLTLHACLLVLYLLTMRNSHTLAIARP